ncbi:MAG: sulfatase-like hydrolase/transferase [Bacteroidales bacterium]|nr:MAG: sulfatase-like hydrolase/transferase [Bacteroidales bacterium]
MKKRILFLFYYALGWLLYFTLIKLLFLLYHLEHSKELNPKEWILVFSHGFKIDLSTASYLMILPFVLSVFHSFIKGSWYKKFMGIYTFVLLTLISLVTVVDLELYTHWGFRIDKTPLLYLDSPKEMMASTTLWITLRQIALAMVLIAGGSLAYRKYCAPQIFDFKSYKLVSGAAWLILTAALIIPIRGGVGIAPLNTGHVYFHTKPFANHAAVNVLWNLGFSIVNSQPVENNYRFMAEDEAEEIFSSLYEHGGETVKILRAEKPNIILMLVESFTSKVIEPLGGLAGITPEFNKRIPEGILFSNIYATGDRTDKGVIGILSGYPSQPDYSIIKFSKKIESLPVLPKDLKQLGYSTAYYYGGSIDFANFRAYLVNSGFDRIVSMDDFDPSTYNSKWGVHDCILLERYMEDLDTTDVPFFHVVLTLSSHEPFDVPMKTVIHGNDATSKFLNSVYYTDSTVGAFIEKARKKSWWSNTLLVLIADHGARYPDLKAVHDPGRYRIPMLWLGGTLELTDTIITKYGSQTDLPATLLNQLKTGSEYPFSKDLLDAKSHSFGYYSFNNGFGFLTDSFRLVFDNVSRKYIISTGTALQKEPLEGKAYLQVIYEDFVSR